MIKKQLPWIITALLTSGCATLPDVNYSYYPRKSNTDIAIVQTLSCTKTNEVVNSKFSEPTIATTYPADYSKGPISFNIKDIEGPLPWLVDSKIGLQLTDDFRLKGISSTVTGQGEAVIKAATTLAMTVATGGAGTEQNVAEGKNTLQQVKDDICAVISKYGAKSAPSASADKSKPADANADSPTTLVLNFHIQAKGTSSDLSTWTKDTKTLLDVSDESGKAALQGIEKALAKIDASLKYSLAYIDLYYDVNPKFTVKLGPQNTSGIDIIDGKGFNATENADEVPVYLQKVKSLPIVITRSSLSRKTSAENKVIVPQTTCKENDLSACIKDTNGAFYSVPIPKAQLFGQESVDLTVNDLGVITSLSYGKTSGVASLLNAGNTIATDVNAGPTPTSEAANIKAQADLVHQKARLAACLQNPNNLQLCTAQ